MQVPLPNMISTNISAPWSGWLGSSAHRIFQARVLEWLSFPIRRGLPDPGIKPVSLASHALTGRFFTNSATWEAHICYQPPAYLSPYFSFPLGYHLVIFLFILVLPILQEAPSSMKLFPTILCRQKYWFLFLSWSYLLNKIY